MKYALLIVLALTSTVSAQCINCQVPTLAPQQVTYSQVLPLQEITVAERRPSILEGMAIRQQSRQAARRASFARYPSVSATYSAGSTGTIATTSLGSTGTYSTSPTTYSFGSTGTLQAAPSVTYSLGSVGTYSTPTPAPTYSLGSTGTPSVTYSTPPTVSVPTPACVCAPACACVNCNCAPAVFSVPATAVVPCLNCVPAAPITYSVPASPPSITYSVPALVSYSPTPSLIYAAPARSSNYAIALRSATERAMRGIKGHLSSIERQAGKRVGVGWSSHNPNPATCFNNLPGDYAVARGRDGYYATKIVY